MMALKDFLFCQTLDVYDVRIQRCFREIQVTKKIHNFQFFSFAKKKVKAQQNYSIGQNRIFLCARFLNGIIPLSGGEWYNQSGPLSPLL